MYSTASFKCYLKCYIFLNLYNVMKKFRTTNLPGNGRQLLFSQIIGSNFFHFIVLFYVFIYICYAFLLLSISLPCELQASEGRLHLALFQARHTHGSSVYLARASQLLNITHTNQTCVQLLQCLRKDDLLISFIRGESGEKRLVTPCPQSDLKY